MPTDPDHDQSAAPKDASKDADADADNQGVSATEPAEGADDAPAPDSPVG